MKRLALFLTFTTACIFAGAQQFVVIKTQEGQEVIPVEDIECITLEQDADFHARLLPRAIAADERTQLFGQALQVTGWADSLLDFVDADYVSLLDNLDEWSHIISVWHTMSIMPRFPQARLKCFSAFVETDSVFAAHGIMDLSSLTAYAHQVYDEIFPSDAVISDPTHPHNALNRFVAYHLLNFGCSDTTLTADPAYFVRDVADVSDWYQTLLPEGTLKVSRPDGTEAGLYLNRRGVQDSPDKYGVKIRGAKIIPSPSGILTQKVSNGAYFYIDDLLLFGRQTQQEVLNDRWTVDFVTLSPDFMNNDTRLQHQFDWNKMAFSTIFLPGTVAGFDSPKPTDFCVSPYWYNINYYGGESISVGSVDGTPIDITVTLPVLPQGEWEIRFGCAVSPFLVGLRFSIDETGLQDSLEISQQLYRSLDSLYFSWMKQLTPEEEIVFNKQLRSAGWMRGPKTYSFSTQQNSQPVRTPENSKTLYDSGVGGLRRIIGRVHSDGKRPFHLRIESYEYDEVYDEKGHINQHIRPHDLDFLEFCPSWIVDNEEIPEE